MVTVNSKFGTPQMMVINCACGLYESKLRPTLQFKLVCKANGNCHESQCLSGGQLKLPEKCSFGEVISVFMKFE